MKNSTKRIDFKERFKGKTSLMGKDGHMGIVEKANKPITDLNSPGLGRPFRVSGRTKRAISQDYTFNTDLHESRSVNGNVKSGDIKRRKYVGHNHHSLSDAGSSIMQSNDYLRDSFKREDLNRSFQPSSHYSESKSKVIFFSHISF